MYLNESQLAGLGFSVKKLKKAVKKVVKKVTKAPIAVAKLAPKIIKAPIAAAKLAPKIIKAPIAAAKLAPKLSVKTAALPFGAAAKTGLLAKRAAKGLKKRPIARRGEKYAANAVRMAQLKEAAKTVAPAAVELVETAQPATPAPVVATQSAAIVTQALQREGVDIRTPEAEEAIQEAVEETQAKPAWTKFILPAAGAALLLLGKG